MLPRRAECSYGMEALPSRGEGGIFRWPTGPRASARAPPLQPVPREQGAAVARRFHMGHALPSPWEAGAEATEGHGPTASVLRLREDEMPSNSYCSPPFLPAGCSSSCPGLPREQAAESCPPALGAAGAGTGWPAGGRGGRRSKPNKRKITPSPGEGSSSTGACSLGRGKPEPRGKTEICLPAESCCSPADLRCLPAAGARGSGAEPRRGWRARAEPRRARQSTAGRAGSAKLRPVGQTGTCIAGREDVLRTASLQRSIVSLRARSPPWFEDGSPPLPSVPLPCVSRRGRRGGERGASGFERDHKSCGPFRPGAVDLPEESPK